MNDVGRPAAVRQLLTSVGIDSAELVAANTIDDLPVFGVPIKVKQAAELWRRLRARHQDTGLWPFLSNESPVEWAQWCSDSPGGPDRRAAALARSPSDVVDEFIAAQRAGSHEHRNPGPAANRLPPQPLRHRPHPRVDQFGSATTAMAQTQRDRRHNERPRLAMSRPSPSRLRTARAACLSWSKILAVLLSWGFMRRLGIR